MPVNLSFLLLAWGDAVKPVLHFNTTSLFHVLQASFWSLKWRCLENYLHSWTHTAQLCCFSASLLFLINCVAVDLRWQMSPAHNTTGPETIAAAVCSIVAPSVVHEAQDLTFTPAWRKNTWLHWQLQWILYKNFVLSLTCGTRSGKLMYSVLLYGLLQL